MKIKELLNINKEIEKQLQENKELTIQKDQIVNAINNLNSEKESIKSQIEALKDKKKLLIEKNKELQEENKRLQEKGKLQFQEELIELIKGNQDKEDNYINIQNCYIVKTKDDIYFAHKESKNVYIADGLAEGIETNYYNVFNNNCIASCTEVISPLLFAGDKIVWPSSGFSYIHICDRYPLLKLYSDKLVPESILGILHHNLIIENDKSIKSYVKKCRLSKK